MRKDWWALILSFGLKRVFRKNISLVSKDVQLLNYYMKVHIWTSTGGERGQELTGEVKALHPIRLTTAAKSKVNYFRKTMHRTSLQAHISLQFLARRRQSVCACIVFLFFWAPSRWNSIANFNMWESKDVLLRRFLALPNILKSLFDWKLKCRLR